MIQSRKRNFLLKLINKSKRTCFLVVVALVMLFVILEIHFDLKKVAIMKPTYDIEWMISIHYLPLYLRPGQDTALVVPKSIEAIEERNYIACFVMSAPKNTLARNAIRQTWGKLIKPLFLIAIGDNETMRVVADEAQMFDDIIVEDFVDCYLNLTIKTAFAMKNFLKYFEGSEYFFKIDDDVFLNVDNFNRMLKATPSDSLRGKLETHRKPVRMKGEKWFTPMALMSDDEYPPFYDGPSYVIPGHMIQSIYETAMEIPFLTSEDVFFTGIVAGKMLNYSMNGDYNNMYRMTFPLPYNYPCLYENYIAVHHVKPEDLIHLWRRFETHDDCNSMEKLQVYYFKAKINAFGSES